MATLTIEFFNKEFLEVSGGIQGFDIHSVWLRDTDGNEQSVKFDKFQSVYAIVETKEAPVAERSKPNAVSP